MNHYQHFQVATYLIAYDLAKMTADEIRSRLQHLCDALHIGKIYIENHRGNVDIPQDKLRQVKALCESFGLQTAGGITYTQHIGGVRKGAIFDTFCYTDPSHTQEAIRIATQLAQVFDEIILDDFFFTACRCEMCIDAKGSRSWKQYRLALMEKFSRELYDAVKKANPGVKFVIKFPNWYESYAECGYYPEKQKDIFDGIFTGNETRTPFDAQHLQRYESYSVQRLMENTAPGKNGGGWIDLFGSLDRTENLLQQVQAALLAGARELMLWNFSMYSQWPELEHLAGYLTQIDRQLGLLGAPMGLPVWEPFNADAEEQIYNYLGMRGAALEPTPYFDRSAPAVLFTAATAEDPSSLDTLKRYVRSGGSAIATLGYYRAMYDKGIHDLSSVTLTGRHILGKDYRIQHANYYNDVRLIPGREAIGFEALQYKTNATHCNVAVMGGECNFPVLTEDNYGKGRFFLLNLPENFADLYKLPGEVIAAINKHLSAGLPAYVGSEGKLGLYLRGNGRLVLRSYSGESQIARVMFRGDVAGLRDAETGTVYRDRLLLPLPSCMADAVTVIPEPPEYAVDILLNPWQTIMLEYDYPENKNTVVNKQ